MKDYGSSSTSAESEPSHRKRFDKEFFKETWMHTMMQGNHPDTSALGSHADPAFVGSDCFLEKVI